MGSTQLHAGVDVFGGGVATLEHPHGAQQVGHEQHVDDETSPVLRRDDRLADDIGGEAGDPVDNCRQGAYRGDDLDQLHDRSRIEEMEADNLLGSTRTHRYVDDGNRRRVGGQDGLGGRDHPVQLGEHLGLESKVLDDGLDDQVTVGEIGEIGGERQVAECGRMPILVELAPLERPTQRALDPRPAALSGGSVDFAHDRRQPGLGHDLGHAAAHLSSAHDAYLLNAHLPTPRVVCLAPGNDSVAFGDDHALDHHIVDGPVAGSGGDLLHGLGYLEAVHDLSEQ